MSVPAALDRHLRDLLSSGQVRCVLGPAAGCGPRGTAHLARTPEAVDRFELSPLACANVLVHLTSEEARRDDARRPVAVLARPCETRMLNQLLSERAIERDELHVVGLGGCRGVIDSRKLRERLPELRGFPEVREEGDTFVIEGEGMEPVSVPRNELLLDRCSGCDISEPLFHDHTFPLADAAPTSAAEAECAPEPSDEGWDYWADQFERCIRCYACRDACPLCYCEDCVLDRLRPMWVPRSVSLKNNTAYQLIRVLHLSGRCTACGECEQACPVDLPLLTLARKMEQEMRELYRARSGFDPEGRHPMSVFDPNDPEGTDFEEQGR